MRRTPQQWLTLFETQKESQLSIKQFCLEQGLATSTFYKHKAIFTSEASMTTSKQVSPFSQVYLVEPDKQKTTPLKNIKLNIGNIELTFDGQTEVNWLVSLVEQLA